MQWVSVTDKLPDDICQCLVHKTLNIGKQKHPYITIATFSPVAKKASMDFEGDTNPVFYTHDSEWGDLRVENITHWMPLPQPPEVF